MKQSGVDKYGLPLCGNKSQEKIRQSAMSKYNKIIKKENINIEKAEELRFYPERQRKPSPLGEG